MGALICEAGGAEQLLVGTADAASAPTLSVPHQPVPSDKPAEQPVVSSPPALVDALDERGQRAYQIQRKRSELRQIEDLVPPRFQELVLDVAAEIGVDPRMVAAVGQLESQWHPDAYGAHGDTGLMQIIPDTAQWISQQMGLKAYDLWDPRTNVTMGAWYLRVLYQEYGDWGKALAHYNGGPLYAPKGDEFSYTIQVKRLYREGVKRPLQ